MTPSLPFLGLTLALRKNASSAEKNYEELKNRLSDNQARDTAIIAKLSDDLDAAQNVTDKNGNPVARQREKVRREAAEAQRFYRAIQERETELWDRWDKGRSV